MAGQLTIDTLKASSGPLSVQNGMTGIAKAWVSFNGSTAAIIASFNVGSITKTSTGRWTVNLTTAMQSSSYCTLAAGNVGTVVAQDTYTGSLTTTSFAVGTNYNGNAYDSGYVTATAFSA